MSLSNLDGLYRQVIMDHYKNPRNKGILDDGTITIDMNNPTCGDRIRLMLRTDNNKIMDAKFDGEGCSISMSSASMMTQAVKGRSIEEALQLAGIFSEMIQGKTIQSEIDLGDIEALSGVAKFPARIKCATLAWKALESGIEKENKE